MDNDIDALTVKRNEATGQFEAVYEDQLAILTYRVHGANLLLPHTLVPPAIEGRGIAGLLARHALEFAREQEFRVIPACPYVAQYLREHPEYVDLVDPSMRTSYGISS